MKLFSMLLLIVLFLSGCALRSDYNTIGAIPQNELKEKTFCLVMQGKTEAELDAMADLVKIMQRQRYDFNVRSCDIFLNLTADRKGAGSVIKIYFQPAGSDDEKDILAFGELVLNNNDRWWRGRSLDSLTKMMNQTKRVKESCRKSLLDNRLTSCNIKIISEKQ